MNTREIIEISKANKIHPNKSLGQCFLCNKAIIDRIVEVSGIERSDNILEIGPGLGALTESLVERAKSVTVVEIDAGLAEFLRQKFYQKDNLKIIHGDFLKLKLEDNFSRVISNLPYYCSSEILIRIAREYGVREVYIMLQKEMAERLVSRPGTKSYGAFTVSLGFYYEPEILFHIDSSSFYPKPDVASSFVQLIYRENPDLNREEIDLFHRIVKAAFWGRRKTLAKTLIASPHVKLPVDIIKDTFIKMNLDERIRGEKLAIHDYILLARLIYKRVRETE